MLTLIYGFALVASSFTLGLFGIFLAQRPTKKPKRPRLNDEATSTKP